jgi:hypothetical protein
MEQADRDMLIRIDERTEAHGRQLDDIHKIMNNGGCSKGKKNGTDIKWIWTIGTIVAGGIIGAIGFLHR